MLISERFELNGEVETARSLALRANSLSPDNQLAKKAVSRLS